MTLEVRPKEMVENLKIRNWAVVQTATHTIKGSSGYFFDNKVHCSRETIIIL